MKRIMLPERAAVGFEGGNYFYRFYVFNFVCRFCGVFVIWKNIIGMIRDYGMMIGTS